MLLVHGARVAWATAPEEISHDPPSLRADSLNPEGAPPRTSSIASSYPPPGVALTPPMQRGKLFARLEAIQKEITSGGVPKKET
jgi:hypothetical protein